MRRRLALKTIVGGFALASLLLLWCSNIRSDDDWPGKVDPKAVRSITWDWDGNSWQPWNTSQCQQYMTRFGQGLPRVNLISFPCSGNTWVRYLLECGTGVFTGSIYRDIDLIRKGFLGERDGVDSGRTLVQKTHGAGLGTDVTSLPKRHRKVEPDHPAIFILRNPSRAIISFWHFRSVKGHTRHTSNISLEIFHNKEFRKHFLMMILKWEQMATDQLLWSRAPVHVVYYEDVVKNPISQLRQMVDFLRVPVDEGRLRCLESHLEGHFHRPPYDFDPFTPEQKVVMGLAVDRVRRLLKALGYPDLPHYEGLPRSGETSEDSVKAPPREDHTRQ